MTQHHLPFRYREILEHEFSDNVADDIEIRIVIAVPQPFKEHTKPRTVRAVLHWLRQLNVLKLGQEGVGAALKDR